MRIPSSEIQIQFIRSGGAGGQNVNKVSTKVQLFWNVRNSRVFNAEEKNRMMEKLSHVMTGKGDILVSASSERSQAQNRVLALAKLHALIKKSLVVPKKRRPTRPSRASKEKRLDSKKIRSKVKKQRSQKVFFV